MTEWGTGTRLATRVAVTFALVLSLATPLEPAGAVGPCGTQPQPTALIRGADTVDKVPVDPDGGAAVYPGWNWVDAYGRISNKGIGGCSGVEPSQLTGAPQWPGWDIARGLALYQDGSGTAKGWVLDGWGGMHPLAGAPPFQGPYWRGWDIARDLAATADGSWGLVLDGFGAIHRFGNAPGASESFTREVTYWPGWDIARAVVLEPDGRGGWVFDAWGGVHPFGGARQLLPADSAGMVPAHYMPGRDWVRTASIEVGSYSEQVIVGGVLDGQYVQARWNLVD